LRFAVCDNGSAIPAHLADQLLHTVVPSEDGLGVGLYQTARWARQLDYQLSLRDNVNGHICFELAGNSSETR
jgi:nitrogen-specific signal transduction histidine kinase